MLRNYLKTALRSIKRNKTFTFINVFGLSLSLSICLIIIMMVADQMSMDRYNDNARNIYRVNMQRLHSTDMINTMATAPLMLANELTENYTGVEKAVRIRRGFGNNWVGIENDINIPLGGFFVDPEFVNMFQYEFEQGNALTALNQPYSVVLSKKAAKKLYGDKDPIGEIVDMGEIGEYKVTGVLKDTDHKSHIAFEALASMSTTDILEADSIFDASNKDWDYTTSGWVYIQLGPNTKKDEILGQLIEIDDKQYAENKLVNYRFQLQNILDVNPGPLIGNQIGPGMPAIFVYFLAGLALIIMTSACFNYTNLSIAKSLSRAKEVGIRKVSGAFRKQLFTQFLIESIIISVSSLGFAYVLLLFLEPAFLSLKFVNLLKWSLSTSWEVVAASIIFAVLVGVLAGLFPAAVLSSFQPIKVLKDLSNMKIFSKMGIRKALLIGQLTLSLFFIISVILLFNQVNLMVNAQKGFETSNMINIPLKKTDGALLKTELMRQGNIESVTLVSHIPAGGTANGQYFKRNLEDERTDVNYFAVDEDYLKQMGIKLVAGRNFDPEANKEHETQILINLKAVEVFQFENAHDALGKVIYREDSTELIITGIVENYHHAMMMQEIGPMALRYRPAQFSYAHVKVNEKNTAAGIKQVEQAWHTVNPNRTLEYKMLEEEIREFYDMMFGDLIKIIGLFSFIALSIASLGMLGMAIYTTQTRMKEMSIRKIMGASSQNVVYILSRGFAKMLIISIVIAVPLSYFINNLWLQSMAYRTEISVGVILLGTVILLLMGALTIGSQTWNAGRKNPVDSLRSE